MDPRKLTHSEDVRQADNDNRGGAAGYEVAILSVVSMLARYSSKTPDAANDNCQQETSG